MKIGCLVHLCLLGSGSTILHILVHGNRSISLLAAILPLGGAKTTAPTSRTLLFAVCCCREEEGNMPSDDADSTNTKKAYVELFFGSSKCERGYLVTVPFSKNYCFKFSDLISKVLFELSLGLRIFFLPNLNSSRTTSL